MPTLARGECFLGGGWLIIRSIELYQNISFVWSMEYKMRRSYRTIWETL